MIAMNPFPGMNPYLEQRWGDVHAGLVTYTRDLLQEFLPDDLRVRMQERVFIESAGNGGRSVYPDVHVYAAPSALAGTSAGSGGAAIAEPIIIRVAEAQITESYVELIDTASGGRVVTVIEFLSPTNKTPGPGRDLYLQKQKDTRRCQANLVEIDLLRGGNPTTLTPPALLKPEERTPYHVSVFRAIRPDAREYYPLPLRDALRTIRIPLRETDADVMLDLRALLELCFRRGRYDDIDYELPLEPRMTSDDAEWIEQVLKEKRPR